MIATKTFTWLINGEVKTFKDGAKVDLPDSDLKKAQQMGLVKMKDKKEG